MRIFRVEKLIALAVGALLLAVGCAKVQTSSTRLPNGRLNSFTIPHVLRYATAEDVSTLNPMLLQQNTLGLMSSLTAAWLIKWNAQNKPYAELATEVPTKANGGISKDGLTITYHLRKGLKWSDGYPLNADDVVWSTHAVLNPANNVTTRTGWNYITKIDEPNKYTVIYHLSRPYSPFIVTFFSSAGGNPSILPEHLLAKYPNINNVPFNALPVGAGPFKYKEWQRSQRVVMVRNPYYFRGEPKLKEIDFEIIPDRDTILTDLQARQLDMWNYVPGNYYDKTVTLAPYTSLRQPAYLYDHVDFNMNSPKLRDPAVRKALELATDRQTIIQKIQHGIGILQEGIAPKNAPYYDPSIPLVPFDIAKANAILDAAGWKRGADGIREKNGVKLDLDYATTTGTQDVDSEIELMRSWWKQIGVAINVRHYPTTMLFAPYADGGIVYGGKWDVIGFAWGDDPIGDFSFVYACDEIPPLGQNDLRWCDPKANAAMHALYTHYDQPKRNADDRILFTELAKQTPMFVLLGREDIYVYNRDLKNFHPNAVTPFDNMMNVDI